MRAQRSYYLLPSVLSVVKGNLHSGDTYLEIHNQHLTIVDSLTSEMRPSNPLGKAQVLFYPTVTEDSSLSHWRGYASSDENSYFKGIAVVPSFGMQLGAFVVSRNTYHTDTLFFEYKNSTESMNFQITLKKIDDRMIERAQTILAIRDSAKMPFYRRRVIAWKDLEHFAGYIESPMKKTKFYLFTTAWVTPGFTSIFCSFSDTLVDLPRKTTRDYEDPVLIDFLNQRLAEEPLTDSQSVLQLAKFYNELAGNGEGDYRILSSWKDIPLLEGQSIPEEVKELIGFPSVAKNDNGYSAILFVGHFFFTETLQVTISYDGMRMSVRKNLIGSFGPRAFKM